MNELTKPTFIHQNNEPVFVVIPYSDWLQLTKKSDEDIFFPHNVVSMIIEHSMTPIKAWRKHLKMTQNELANKLGVSQANIVHLEKSVNPHFDTKLKIAKAFGIDIEQLDI